MIGNKLGSYEIIEEIGKGGMAAVYRAYQPSMDRDVAVKVILKNLADSDAGIMRFQREARLIARLEHLHILPVYDFDGAHEPPYIVMRYLEGGTLKDIMQQSQLPLAEVAYLMRQVGGAVDYAHRQGIVHRDIKPSNIMVDREGNTFVTDFGIARMAGSEEHEAGKPITQTGAIIGTPDYMSPEQGMGYDDVDHRADIYSLGVMLFEMLTGETPFPARTPMEVVMKHVQDPVPDIRTIQPDLPETINNVIQRALAKEREDRYDRTADFIDAMTEALGGNIAATPTQLRSAAEESQIIILQRREAIKDQIQQTLSGFEKARGRSRTGTDSQSTPTEQNKVITAISVNAAEYAEIVDEIEGGEAARKAINALWNASEKIVIQNNGDVFARTEDTLLALWGADATGEDDAEQAVMTALAIQAKLRELGAEIFEEEGEDEPLPLKIGINTGLALLTPSDETGAYAASGATISLTNRLAETAYGLILISHETFRSVQGIFSMEEDNPLRVRGRKESVATYRVISVKPRAFRADVRGVHGIETAMVGRESELKHLQNALEDAFEEEETQVITVIGEAGLGKSRLLTEFEIWADLHPTTYRLFQGRATASMTGRPYALLRDMISFRFEILDSDAQEVVQEKMEAGIQDLTGQSNIEMAHMIGQLVGFDFSESQHIKGILSDPKQLSNRARQLFKRMFTQISEEYPIVMQLEDIHHADEASLTLLNELVEEQDELPMVMIALARPGLLERFPTWGSGQDFHLQVTLEPLPKRDSRALVREILQKIEDVPKSLRDLIVDQAEGNPYFMEEVVKMMIEDRVIIPGDDHWAVEESKLEHLRVPTTLVGLLQARLDTLLYPEKLTLQRAAVLGRIFYDSALMYLNEADETDVEDLPRILETLLEREFIYERGTTAFEGHIEFIFAKSMMRDSIYDSLLRRQKRTYHVATAEWLIDAAGERVDEYIALIAEHYELGEDNARAAEFLIKAGDKADQMSMLADAAEIHQKALSLLPKDAEREIVQLQLKIGENLYQLGELDEVQELLDSALATARKLQDPATEAKVLLGLSRISTRSGNLEESDQLVHEALQLAQHSGNLEILTEVYQNLAGAETKRSRAEQREFGEKALELARQIGDVKAELHALNTLGLTWHSEDPDKAIEYYNECIRIAKQAGNRLLQAFGLGNTAVILLERGNPQEALDYIIAALDIVRELGNTHNIVAGASNAVETYLRIGNVDAALPYLQESIQSADKLGSLPFWITVITTAAMVKIAQGEVEEGLKWVGLSLSHPAARRDAQEDLQRFLDVMSHLYEGYDAKALIKAGESLDADTVIEQMVEEYG